MGIVHKFRDYILESELKITILENRVDIVNYTEIGHFDSNKIIVKWNYKKYRIKVIK